MLFKSFLAASVTLLLISATANASTPPPVVLQPSVCGQLTDNGLDGSDQATLTNKVKVGGANQSILGTKEFQSALEFDLSTPAIQRINRAAINQVTLTLPPDSFTSTGLLQIAGVATGYVGDGLLGLSDANQGTNLASFTLYGRSVPVPVPTPVLDVTSFVLDRLAASDQFAGFNLRATTVPPEPQAIYETFSGPFLTFYLPEPTTAVLGLAVVAFAACRRRRR